MSELTINTDSFKKIQQYDPAELDIQGKFDWIFYAIKHDKFDEFMNSSRCILGF